MRRSKTIKIDGYERQIEIKELTVRQIINIAQAGNDKLFASTTDGSPSGSLADLRDFIESDLLPLCSNLSIEEIMDFPPSAVEEIINCFQEVNKSFFAVAGKTGLSNFGTIIKQAMLNDFSKMLAGSLKQDTGKEYLTMDTPTLSMPGTNI